VRMVLQVHDDLLFEVPAREVPDFSKWVKKAMEGAAKLRVPLQVDVKLGPNWADMDGEKA
jgi:DNA polymerase I